MTKATELRLGNWISYKGEFNFVVANINHEGAGDHEDAIYFETNLTPIEISPEILEKAGFERQWEGRWERGSVEIEQSEEQKILGGYILLNGEERSHWPNVYFYVHQLQNLYFALTNSELTIQL